MRKKILLTTADGRICTGEIRVRGGAGESASRIAQDYPRVTLSHIASILNGRSR